MMTIATDTQFQEHVVGKVVPCDNGWEIGWRDGFCLFVTNERCQVAPEPGELARLYGKGFGYTVRGVVIGGRVYRYESEQEEADSRQRYIDEQKRERREKLDAERDERDQRIAALPEPLRRRIWGFHAATPNWRAEYEPYELFVCEEAAKIQRVLETRQAIADFSRKPWEEQKAQLPEVSSDHSGNTFGMACQLAATLADRPDLVPKMHGAMCPLVGCKDYGCFATRQ